MDPMSNVGHSTAHANSIDMLSAQMSSLTTNDETSFCATNFEERFKAYVRGLKGFRMELRLIRLMYTVALEALGLLQERKYECFDALVSECACHLRTLKICHIATRSEQLYPYVDRLKQVVALIDGLLPKNIHFAKCDFQKMVETYGLDVQVPDDLIFLTQSRLLTLTRKVELTYKECSDCQKWVETTDEETASEQLACYDTELTKGYRHKLVMQTKMRLAARSVAFIQQQAHTISPFVCRMLGAENVRVIEQRMELPCAYSLTHVVTLAAQSNFPILLKAQRCLHLFEDPVPLYDTEVYLMPHEGHYKPAEPPKDRQKPVIVLEGRRLEKNGTSAAVYKERLLDVIARLSFEKLVEMFSTYHDQYTGAFRRLEDIPVLAHDQAEASRLTQLRNQAEEIGITRSNQSLLLITHMFVGTMAQYSIYKE